LSFPHTEGDCLLWQGTPRKWHQHFSHTHVPRRQLWWDLIINNQLTTSKHILTHYISSFITHTKLFYGARKAHSV
jgi:ABC-type uncharacterized transport system ATPase subunit